jgi:hypothetical protein
MNAMRIGALAALLILSSSCRETIPVDQQLSSGQVLFRFSPGDYYSFDNWNLDIYGRKIPASYFRSSWTVADTGQTLRGWTRVSVVLDSTFDGNNVFVRRDSLLFRHDNGDLYQYGFIRSLIAARETLTLVPRWDRIAAFSQPLGTSWEVGRIDSSVGPRPTEYILGRIQPTREYVGPFIINGQERAMPSYRVQITESRLDYTFWITESPTTIARVFDNSNAIPNATLRELRVVTLR